MAMVMEAESDLHEELREAEQEILALKQELEDQCKQHAEMIKDKDIESSHDNISHVINEFLDLIERPVGKLSFVIPQTDSVNRAILHLYDAVERQI